MPEALILSSLDCLQDQDVQFFNDLAGKTLGAEACKGPHHNRSCRKCLSCFYSDPTYMSRTLQKS